jgi:hypothetical protein
MPNYSLIFAPSLQAADDAAVNDWRWERYNEMRDEYRRPDTGERARFVKDGPQSLQNLRWSTRVYLVDGWRKRTDASSIMGLLDSGFFVETDPELPPPRPRKKRDEVLSEVRKQLSRLEQP